MKIKQVLSVVLVLLLCFSMLSACSSKPNTGNAVVDAMDTQTLAENLVKALNQITVLKGQIEGYEDDIDRLQTLVQGVQYTDPEFPAITRVEDETGRTTFNKPGSYLLLPETLAYPGVAVLPNNSSIQMGGANAFTVSPSLIWMYRLEGNKLFLSSDLGIYGEIVIGKSSAGAADMDMINVVFDGHSGQQEERDQYDRVTQIYIPQSEGLVETVPADPGKSSYRNDEPIFWSNNTVGRQVSLNTSVNGGSAVLRVGLFSVGQIAVLYTFAYDTARDGQFESAIMALLQTVTVQGKAIAVGF